MPCSATSAEKNISYAVQHQCPQCGAPVTLGEDARFFVCEFCRVRSFISQKGFPRYYLPASPKAPEDADIVYIPYWRFKGVRYICRAAGITPKFTDISVLARQDLPQQIPFSLGFRSQALTMKLIGSDTKGRFLKPMPSAVVLKERSGPDLPNETTFQEDIGETFSLIYAPFYLKNGSLMDAVINEALPMTPGFDSAILDKEIVRPEADTHFIAGICPGCGWDLEGASDSLVLVCRNCKSIWWAKSDRLVKIKFKAAAPANATDLMVPFWKIRAQISPMKLDSHGDLAKMAPQTGVPALEWDEKPLYFWCPAFKVRPNIFLRLLGQITTAQPAPSLAPVFEENPCQTINLPPSEAVQSIRVTMASLLRPRKEIIDVLPVTEVVSQQISLVFLPFESRHHDIVYRNLNIAINKNALALSANL